MRRTLAIALVVAAGRLHAQVAEGEALAPIAAAVLPAPQPLTVTLVPPPSSLAAISAMQLPLPAPLTVTLRPPPSALGAIAAAKLPSPHPLTVTLVPGAFAAGPLAPPKPGAVGVAVVTPEALAAVATATFPQPQPLSVTLVPPATPLSAISGANFPAAQALSVTLVPPPTPLAAIAAATFPTPQPLSVTLYAGEPLVAATMLAGIAPSLALGPGQYAVQIVQVIPRRGAQFFDYRDPAGAGTVLVAGATTQTVTGAPLAGGGPVGPVCVAPATPPLSADICGTTLSLSDDGFPFGANLGPQGNRSMHLTPVGGAQIQIVAQTGITPNATCPGLLCMTTQVFTPGAACDNVSFVDTGTPKAPIVKFRRNGGQVCAQRLQ
jgi:hypothetical protein